MRSRPKCLVAVIILVAGYSPAQQSAFRTETNLVLVPTLVTDEKASPIFGLRSTDFSIEDNGVAQNVHLDDDLDGEPISLVVCIQTGRSASAESRRMSTLPTLLEPLMSSGKMEIAVVQFDSGVELVQDFTRDAARATESLNKLAPGDGGAAILNALSYSANILSKTPQGRQRILLLISETRDHGSRAVKMDDVVRSIGISNTLVYAVAFSPTVSSVVDDLHGDMEQKQSSMTQLLIQSMRKNVPKAVASMTGGEYELFKSKRGFETRISHFTNHLYSRYLLSFTPTDPHPGLHTIRVSLKQPKGKRITARTSYWSKEEH